MNSSKIIYKDNIKSILTKSKLRIVTNSLNNYNKGLLLLSLLFIEIVGVYSFDILQQVPISVTAQSFKTFENAALGAKVQFPADWSVEFESLTATFKSPSGTYGIQLSAILEQDDDLDLEEAAEAVLNSAKISGQYVETLNSGSTSINGDDYYSLLLRIQANNEFMTKDLYLLTEAGGTIYLFKFQSLDDPNNRELSDQSYSAGLNILQSMVTTAELTGLNLDEFKEGSDSQFNPFKSGPSNRDGFSDPDSNRGEIGDNNNGGENTFPRQQPSEREPLCGPGSCVIS